jgi:hypothetical protein
MEMKFTSKYRITGLLILFILALLPAGRPASAQVDYTTGSLRGTVNDPQGAVVSGATVTVTNSATGVSRTANSGKDGGYQIPALPAANYQITIEAPGCSKILIKKVELGVGQSLSYDAHMKAGSPSETVEVSGKDVSMVDASRSSQANSINPLQMENLPNLTRSFTLDAYMLPGISSSEAPRIQTPGFTWFLTSGFSIGGNNGRNTISTIDGGENESGTGQLRVTNLPLDATQEFQVNRSAYASEYGFTSVGAINIVTRGGGNNWHGDAFGFYHNQSTDSANFFNGFSGTPKAFSQDFITGGSFGGPIVKNKLFFYLAYEYQRMDTPNFGNADIFAAPSVLGLGAPGLGTNCAAQFTGKNPDQLCYVNALKSSGDPFLVGFANGITPGLSPLNNPALNTILNRDSGVFNSPDRLQNVVMRFDYLPDEKDSINVRLGYAHNNFRSPMGGVQNGTPDSYMALARDFNVFGDWTRTINSNVVNQLLVQIVPRDRSQDLPLQFTGVNFSLGSLGAPGPGGYSSFGSPSLLPYKAQQDRYQVEDNVSWIMGAHTFKAGVSVQAANYHIEDDLWFNTQFDFRDGLNKLISLAPAAVQAHLVAFNLSNGFPATGPTTTNLSGPQSFAFGIPSDVIAGFGNPAWHGWGSYFGSFLQDSWKINSRLTMNAGVRLDYDSEPIPVRGNFYAQPRLGFAWDPFGDHKTIIRAGAGIYVAPVDNQIATFGNLLNGSGSFINEVLVDLTPTDPRVAQLWGLGIAGGHLPFGHLTPGDFASVGINTTTPGSFASYSVDANYKHPYTIQASLSVEREIVRNLSLEVAYNMYRGIHLPLPVETGYSEIPVGSILCPTLACTDPTGGPLYSPNTGQNQNITFTSGGSSIYHGVTASLTKRYSHGLQFQANYTYSRTLDDVLDFSSTQAWFRPSRLNLYRAPSAFDVPHLFTVNATYTLPCKPGNGVVSTIFSDINLTPVFTARSGMPFSVLTPSLVNKINNQTIDNLLATPFLASRDSNRGAAFYSFDMSFQKTIYLMHDRGVWLRMIVQGTNLLNRTNFNGVNDIFDPNGIPSNGIVPTAGGGTVNLLTGPFTGLQGVKPTSPFALTQPLAFSSAFAGRQVQFGLKLGF